MRSAALPPLPSVRARELEKRAAASSQENHPSEGEDVGESARPTAEPPPPTEEQQSLPASVDLHPTPPETTASREFERQRSEQLTALRQKERQLFGGRPPLETNVACNVIHQHISTTSAFLNSFIADAGAANEGIDRKLTVLETQMALLESKISSIPGLLSDEENNINQ